MQGRTKNNFHFGSDETARLKTQKDMNTSMKKHEIHFLIISTVNGSKAY